MRSEHAPAHLLLCTAVFLALSLLTIVPARGEPAREALGVATLVPGPPSCPQASPVRTAFERVVRDSVQNASFSRVCYTELSDIPSRVRDILTANPKVLVVWGSAVAARMAIDASGQLPIVFGDIPDPVANGLVDSLGRPGGRVTGISSVAFVAAK